MYNVHNKNDAHGCKNESLTSQDTLVTSGICIQHAIEYETRFALFVKS